MMIDWITKLLVISLLPADAAIASISGQIQAHLIIHDGCTVNVLTPGPDDVRGEFTILDFGDHGPTWSAPLKTYLNAVRTNSLEVECNTSVSGFTVAINGGEHRNGVTRQLSNGSHTLAYQLFLDSANTYSYDIDQPQTYSVADRARAHIPVYGVVKSKSRAVPPGIYSDLLTVTLDW